MNNYKIIKLILNFCLVITSFQFFYSSELKAKSITKNESKLVSIDEINKILNTYKIKQQDLGLVISNLDEEVVSINKDKKFIPASISKLITSYAVLKEFDLNFKFKTELYFDGQNLYFKGGGNPSFVSENMWFMVNEFLRQDIKIIPGDIIVDDTIYDQVRFDDSRESKRVDRSYDSPVGALSFNWNSINVFIKPGETVNSKAQVYLDPDNEYFKLVNKTLTKEGRLKNELIIDVNQNNRTITVSGEVLKTASEKPYFKNVAFPEIWSGLNLKAFLNQRGVKVLGEIKKGQVPKSLNALVTHESKDLSMILKDMNKFSNNFVAEMLTKAIAFHSGENPATLKTGVALINKSLTNLGIKANELNFQNPSGFTRDNEFSPKTMNLVLYTIQKDFRVFPILLDSLPISGIDGTLKNRFKDSKSQGFIRAKTGYLNGVVSLAGYLGLSSGQILHFTLLYNGPQDEARVRQAFDQILNLFLL